MRRVEGSALNVGPAVDEAIDSFGAQDVVVFIMTQAQARKLNAIAKVAAIALDEERARSDADEIPAKR